MNTNLLTDIVRTYFNSHTIEGTLCKTAEGTCEVFLSSWPTEAHIACRATANKGVLAAGFAVDLPCGDFYTVNNDFSLPARKYSDARLGERISLDTYPMTFSQVFFLECADFTISFGRRTNSKRDYQNGWLERTEQGWRLVWIVEPQQPYPRAFEAQVLHFFKFGSLEEAAAAHADWARRTFRYLPLDKNPKVPGWLRKTPLIFQFNLGETTGGICHDYFDLQRFLEDIHSFGVPPETIVYIPDYSQIMLRLLNNSRPGICFNPDSPVLGGEAAFRRALETAQKYRYHLMPHIDLYLFTEWFNFHLKNEKGKTLRYINPGWEAHKKFAILTKSGRPIGWPPEEIPEAGSLDQYPYQIRYLDQSIEEVREEYLARFTQLVREYGLDSLYFDSLSIVGSLASLSCWNSPSHGSQNRVGERKMVEGLYHISKDLLLAGETCDEETLDLVPLWNYRPGIFSFMFGDLYYSFAHTSTPSHIPMRYAETGGISQFDPSALEKEIELCRRQKNAIPRLLVNYRDFGLDSTHRESILRLIRSKEN